MGLVQVPEVSWALEADWWMAVGVFAHCFALKSLRMQRVSERLSADANAI
jgi:hypothetical protein